ncbi:MAG: ABC transporter permease [Gemmatimonadetes bacterium]|nr:ABC transporter permease [Gemmatimonadota bacterium]
MHTSIVIGLQALRVNPLRTLLSALGVIMGVGALVSVLAMGDGVERFTRDQMERTTDLLAVSVQPVTGRRVDGVFLPRPDTVRFTIADVETASRWSGVAGVDMMDVAAGLAQHGASGKARDVRLMGTMAGFAAARQFGLARGAYLSAEDVQGGRRVVVLGGALDAAFGHPALGDSVVLNGAAFAVIGALVPQDTADVSLVAYVPIGTIPALAGAPPRNPASLLVRARVIEDVAGIKRSAERWLQGRLGAAWKERAEVRANDERRQQMQQAMAVFKLLMAAITGVSLLVGGVGIMNVLLASVAERTREIGVRKALGARNRDIRTQFLAESVAITSAGAAFGTALGYGVAEFAAWVMRVQTKAPVHPAITPVTILFAVCASVSVGIGFGLYPALRAARLSPIDAIRHE